MRFNEFFQKLRIFHYKILSNNKNIVGTPKVYQPILFTGEGTISFGKDVRLGYFPSPYFYNSTIYIEARNKESKIVFCDQIRINNGCVFIAEGEGIEIGSYTMMGTNCEIIDSDFHDLEPSMRHTGKAKTAKVTIGKNVFIGSNVKILKGVTIGDNSVIANGSIVTKSIEKDVIAGGNPAKVIKRLSDEIR